MCVFNRVWVKRTKTLSCNDGQLFMTALLMEVFRSSFVKAKRSWLVSSVNYPWFVFFKWPFGSLFLHLLTLVRLTGLRLHDLFIQGDHSLFSKARFRLTASTVRGTVQFRSPFRPLRHRRGAVWSTFRGCSIVITVTSQSTVIVRL